MHNAGHFSGIMHLKHFRFEHAPENVSGAERDEIHPAGVAPIHWLRALSNGGTDALIAVPASDGNDAGSDGK